MTLKPFQAGLTAEEWRRFWESFRDPEIAEWNGNKPLKTPLWLFKRIIMGEVRRGERMGFVVLDENGEWLGTLEFYNLENKQADLGIILGRKDRWGQGYGREAVRAALEYVFGRLGLEKVYLTTFAHNERARRAFEAAGFREFGSRLLPGRKLDIIMVATPDSLKRPDE